MDLQDHPFYIHMQQEAYQSRGERAWIRWINACEKMIGHDLDGDEDRDVYSYDFAYSFFKQGDSVEDYIDEVRYQKTQRALPYMHVFD